jgi:superfamily I DNA and RNA helicase
MHDVLIIDEGQDFAESWRDAMLRLLHPEGRALWLEDPMQNLYGRAPVPLPGWVTLRSQANYRSPRQIVDLLAGIVPDSERIQAASPFIGPDVERLVYPAGDAAAMTDATKQAITRCLAANFARSDIALLSFQGRAHSTLLQADRLGQHTLRSFTGDYDLLGVPVYREGQLLAESVYRFKGQSAPAVIFTEIDFEALDDRTVRKLFVGMTRARMKLVLVLSERAAALLPGRTQAHGAA